MFLITAQFHYYQSLIKFLRNSCTIYRLTSYFDKFFVFYDKQFGFRPKHSTSHALILLTDKIKEAIDKGFHCCGIFLDLCKAFDTVDHVIFLEKLEYYGIRGTTLKWFSSYLTDRRQYVSVCDADSNFLPITFGCHKVLSLASYCFSYK